MPSVADLNALNTAAREAGLTYAAVREILASLQREDDEGISFGRSVEALRELALATAERLASRESEARLRWETTAFERKLELQNVDADLIALRFALSEEGGSNGWRPSRGLSELIDLALEVREERDRLRAECCATKP